MTSRPYRLDQVPLIELPLTIPVASLVTYELITEYHERVRRDFANARCLQEPLRYQRGSSARNGPNVFSVVVMNMLLREIGWHVAKPAEIEQSLSVGDPLKILGNYGVLTALALRSDDGSYHARTLAEQVRSREIELPVLIPLSELELLATASAEDGASFRLRSDATIFHKPVLNYPSGRFTASDMDPTRGIPSRVWGRGNRTLENGWGYGGYSKGIDAVCLDRDSTIRTACSLYPPNPDLRIVAVQNLPRER